MDDGTGRDRWRGLVGLAAARLRGRLTSGERYRTWFCLVGVALPVALLLIVMSVSVGLATGPATSSTAEIDYWITPESNATSAVTDVAGTRFANSHGTATSLSARSDVEYVTPMLLELLQFETGDGDVEYVLVVGIVPEAGFGSVTPVSSGQLSSGDPYYAGGRYEGDWTGEMVVSEAASETLNVGTGDTISPRSADRNFTTVGVSPPKRAGISQYPVAVARLSELQAVVGAADQDAADQFLVSAPGATADTRAALAGTYPNAAVQTRSGIVVQRAVDQQLPLAMAASALILALVTGTLLVGTTFGFEIAASSHQRSVMKAIGFSGRSRAALIGLETLILAIAGGYLALVVWAVGSLLANTFAVRRFGTRVAVFEPWLPVVGLAAAVLIGVLSVPYLLVVGRRTNREVRFV
jgi:putative ABC transport system permease protein